MHQAATAAPAPSRRVGLRQRIKWWATIVALALAPGLALAQAKAETKAAPADEARVVVFNRTIAVFRAPFLGSAESRARRTSQHIEEVLRRGGPGVVTQQAAPQGSVLLIDGELALLLTPEDADQVRGQTLEAAARTAFVELERVIAETRESRDHARLVSAVVRAAGATVIVALAVWLTWRARVWLVRRLARVLEKGSARIAVGGTQVLHTERVVMLSRWLVRAVSTLLILALLYRWLSFAFTQFPYTRPWGEQLDGFLLGVARQIGSAVIGAIPDLTIAVLIFLLARAAIGLFKPFFDRIRASGRREGWLDADTAQPTQRIFNIGIWLFAIVMAYPYLPGADSEAFKGMSVLIGLMVTVGGSSLIGQAASGLILTYSRTLRLGEYVRISDQEGTVTEVGTFTTKIRTGLGEEITLPNAFILGNVSKNYSRTVQGRGFIVDTTVTIGYDTPWRQVEAMLLEAAHRTPGVLPAPKPRVFQTALADFYPEYRLVCQAVPTEPRPRAEVLAALHANIQDVFNEHGVQIMSPHYRGDPANPKVVPKAAWFTPPAVSPDGAAPGGALERPR